MRILISACLIGNKVRYDGNDVPTPSDVLDKWLADGLLVPICPEIAGGLGVPRLPSEINELDGNAVLDGRSKVLDNAGNDVTEHFIRGAEKALELALANNCRIAILKEKSPSCGSSFVHDGTFSGNKIPGQGVTTALLERNGIKVFSDLEVEKAKQFLNNI